MQAVSRVVRSDVFNKHLRHPGAEQMQVVTPKLQEPLVPVVQCNVVVSALVKLLLSDGSKVRKAAVHVHVEDFKSHSNSFQLSKGSAIVNETFNFSISDITANVRVLVWQDNVLSSDLLIGQVIIPLHRLLPPVKTSKLDIMSLSESGWYEILPLPFDSVEFQPAISDVSKSGLLRPKKSLGYLKVAVELKPLMMLIPTVFVVFSLFFPPVNIGRKTRPNALCYSVTGPGKRTWPGLALKPLGHSTRIKSPLLQIYRAPFDI